MSVERLARELALELAAHPGVEAVAATGSLARGDLGAGSDLDLWVLGPETDRVDLVVDGVEVSLLYTDPGYARSLDCAVRFETGDARILHDPRGALHEIIERVDEVEVRAAIARGTSEVFARLAAALDEDALEAAAIRALSRGAARWFAWSARGWRVPKQRHLEEVLFPQDRAQLARISAVDFVELRGLPDATRAASAPDLEWPLPSAASLTRYLQADRAEDAVAAVRDALPPSCGSLAILDDKTRALFARVHPPALEDARAQARALLDRCGVARLPGGRAAQRALA